MESKTIDLPTDGDNVIVPEVQVDMSEFKKKKTIPRGRPISGRVWKDDLGLSQRASAKVKVKSLRISWKEKETRRAELASIKLRAKAMKDERDAAYAAEAERIKASRARREANSMKNVKYQVVSNTAKLKKISKSQWKNYRKLSDINKW